MAIFNCSYLLLSVCVLVFFSYVEGKATDRPPVKGISDANDYYYWKDYYGKIPSDAFPAGSDAEGKPTYIGQSSFLEQKMLYPTIITEGDPNAYLVIGTGRWNAPRKTKILCSTNNTLFKWVPTDTKKVRFLTGCRQIEGGWSGETLITLGRANHQGRTVTGRVYDSATNVNLNGLWIHDATPREQKLTEFEVLLYNCENPWIEEVPS